MRHFVPPRCESGRSSETPAESGGRRHRGLALPLGKAAVAVVVIDDVAVLSQSLGGRLFARSAETGGDGRGHEV
jgi:hypothetical protein